MRMDELLAKVYEVAEERPDAKAGLLTQACIEAAMEHIKDPAELEREVQRCIAGARPHASRPGGAGGFE